MKKDTVASPPVDAVISWVDGNDPDHRLKRAKALALSSEHSDIPIAAGKDETRFSDNGELRFCLASIRKFMPWIRHIHLVTDQQVPNFITPDLTQEYRLKIVDHKDIFSSYEWALPTFNSRTIETALWRIEDLANHFIYFNDDFLLVNRLNPEDFFRDGKVILRGKWQRIKHYGKVRVTLNLWANLLAKTLLGRTRTMNLAAQMRAAQLADMKDRYYQSPHNPRPVRKKTLVDYYTKNPEVFSENIKYRFRDMSQHLAISLADHLEIVQKNAILLDQSRTAIIRGEQDSESTIRQILEKISQGEHDFLCLGSMEKLDQKLRGEIYYMISKLVDA